MKPTDIVVGQKYRHKNYTNTIYLGIGERESGNHNLFKRKKLIVFFDPFDAGKTGAIVASPKKCSYESFWDGFYPEN